MSSGSEHGGAHVAFLPRPSASRGDVILGPGVLESIERHAVGIGEHAAALAAAAGT